MSNFRTYIRTALFVDFDNIFISFSADDQEISKRFATTPEKWLNWLERHLTAEHVGVGISRRILIRRCYMNPVTFSNFRPDFTRSGFEVVDCPPLTSRGKTSTDIHMVMDILDTLGHSTHFDEFIILSGDADFTPVLVRLRNFDRSTTILSAGFASPAYRSAADFVINADEFIRDGIGFEEVESEPPVTKEVIQGDIQILAFIEKIAASLEKIIQDSGPIVAADLPRYFREVPGFIRSEDWLGCGTLRRLTESLVAQTGKFVITKDDPWSLDLMRAEPLATGEASTSIADRPLIETIREYVLRTVSESRYPVSMPKVAGLLTKEFGHEQLGDNWLGSGSFSNLIAKLNIAEIQRSDSIPPCLYIPSRHELPSSTPGRDDLPARVSRITDTPLLTTEQYWGLFAELAKEVNQNDFHRTITSKSVRDHCVENGVAIGRNHVNFVINSLIYVGVKLVGGRGITTKGIAEKVCENVLKLCRNAQLPLSEADVVEIKQWLIKEL